MLDIYVTAQDKLNCVVRCCDVINNLVALSSKNAVASADDLTPVLVFVIIKANPRALLSNVQFVETFAGDRIESGRDAYYWVNFKSAVEYIKTIL
ncbi:Receptor-mediated endocytosis protein 6 [Caenorhabditis elegans]|nr:Receptor-mediated endocytosis protein 6 [Caenorhabditis elegans]CCD63168.1 Receptor-mediated endocytosis protein 6 [Caenorhabditis elegans]|eukprot:NP_001294826.1 Receptor-mediated endocytosis protein 6 [Caenorhabditis elegans]